MQIARPTLFDSAGLGWSPPGEPALLTKFPSDTEAAGPGVILLGGPLLRQPLVPSLGGTQESLVDILIMYESWNPSPSPPPRF